MAGPIASAFIEITARLQLEDSREFEKGLRGQIKRIESELESLEGAAIETSKAISRRLKDLKIDLNVRDAIRSLTRVDDAVENVVGEIHNLQDADIGMDTAAARRNLKTLDERIAKLSRNIRDVGNNEVEINSKEARKNLEILERAVGKLVAELGDLTRSQPRIDVTAAARDLENLEEKLQDALTAVARLDDKQIKFDVESNELDSLERRMERINSEHIKLKVDTQGLNAANKQLKIAEDHAGALKGAFSRIVAFGLIREAGQAIGQLFSMGVRASGEIQTATVTLNRFFAQTKDLGQTSTEFLQGLRTLALETPFEFKGLAETSRRIFGMGVNADDATTLLSELSDAVSAVGGSQGEIDGVVRALSQLSSKGRVDLQDFRQISENLPSLSRQMQITGVIDELNELHPGLNATIADFESLRKSGLITGQVLRDGIIRSISEIPGVAGAARAASRTLQGALSNLADFAAIEFSTAFAGLGGIIADELNTAFGSVTGQEALSPLAAAVRQVIEAFGRAGESALPKILQEVADIAPEVAGAVEAISQLLDEVIPLLGNLAAGGLTAFSGLTTILKQVASLLNALPVGMQELLGGFVTLATLIPGAGETIKNSFARVGTAVKQVLVGIAEGEKQVALGAAVMNAALTAGALIALTAITQSLAKASQRSDEFKSSVTAASKSLQEFESAGDAALNFVNQFRTAGEGINIGGLEEILDGLTSGELEDALNTNAEGLSTLITEMSRAGKELSGAEMDAALRKAGISAEDLSNSSDDAKVSLAALQAQFAQGAEAAFDAALASSKFVFVTEDMADGIDAAAEKTGNYLGAMDQLERANQKGAKSEIAAAKARGATQDQIDAAIAANTTYTAGLNGTTEETIDYAAALQDLNEEMQKQETLFQGLGERFAGFQETIDSLSVSSATLAKAPLTLADNFIDFALSVDKAGLSADEMNAIANELGATLGQVFSGEELTKIVGAFVTDVETFKTSLEAVVPGIEDLQFEADSFSLDGFINELGKIAEARTKVSANITRLLDEFGLVGKEALDALLASGLSKDQFAIAIEQALQGGEGKLKEIAQRFGDATGPQIQQLAERLAAAGFNKEHINEILGVDAFGDGVTDLQTEVTKLDPVITDLEGKVKRLEDAIAKAPTGRGKVALFDILQDTKRELAGAEGDGTGIDVPAAKAAATTAGNQVADSFNTSVKAKVTSGFAEVSTSVNTLITAMGPSGAILAVPAGINISSGLVVGLSLGLRQLNKPVADAVKNLSRDGTARAVRVGNEIGEELVNSFAEAIDNGSDTIIDAFRDGIDALSDVTLAEGAEAILAFRGAGLVLSIAAAAVGRQASVAFEQGMDLAPAVRRELGSAALAFVFGGLRNTAYQSGLQVGIAFGKGVSDGINANIAGAISAMSRLIDATLQAAKRKAKIGSPSKLFAEIGKNIGEGVATGIVNSIPEVTAAAAAVITAAEGSASSTVRAPTSIVGATGSTLLGNPAATAALRGLARNSSGPSTATGTPVEASVVNNHTWNITAPTEDPEALALRVAARLERRLTQ